MLLILERRTSSIVSSFYLCRHNLKAKAFCINRPAFSAFSLELLNTLAQAFPDLLSLSPILANKLVACLQKCPRHYYFLYISIMYASVIIYTLVALSGVMSSPVQDEVVPRAIGPRTPTFADIPFPRFPSHNQHHKDSKGKDSNSRFSHQFLHFGLLWILILTTDNGGGGCSSGTNTQLNACSAGSPYCCSSDGNGGKWLIAFSF